VQKRGKQREVLPGSGPSLPEIDERFIHPFSAFSFADMCTSILCEARISQNILQQMLIFSQQKMLSL
jgi:hypothetical protein